jgi:hypothetical protein
MPVSFADQVLVFLTNPTNQVSFPGAVGLSAFANTSLSQRYGQGGFQITSVTLGAPSGFAQQLLFDETRITGFREKRSERPERNWYEIKLSKGEAAWIDASFNVPVTLNVQAFPGSLQLGPQGGGVTPAGISDPASISHLLKFQLPVETDAYSLTLNARAFVFVANDPSPAADLRRIASLRRPLQNDPQFLASLDGTADQMPYLFIQLYQKGLLPSPPLSEASVTQAFAAADVLASFMTIPAA